MKTTRLILAALALGTMGLMAEEDGPKQVSIRFEAFSLESADAAALLRAGLEGKALYDKLVEKTGKKEATQEALVVLRARSGERALVEGISEQMYPTEYEIPTTAIPDDNPQPPAPVPTPAPANGATPPTPAPAVTRVALGGVPVVPTAFETRNAGWSLEIAPTLGGKDKIIDLQFAPSYVVKSGASTAGQGAAQTEMPVFETQRIATALTVQANVPFFIGTMNRPPMAKIDPLTAKRTWFAFITGTIVDASCNVQE